MHKWVISMRNRRHNIAVAFPDIDIAMKTLSLHAYVLLLACMLDRYVYDQLNKKLRKCIRQTPRQNPRLFFLIKNV